MANYQFMANTTPLRATVNEQYLQYAYARPRTLDVKPYGMATLTALGAFQPIAELPTLRIR